MPVITENSCTFNSWHDIHDYVSKNTRYHHEEVFSAPLTLEQALAVAGNGGYYPDINEHIRTIKSDLTPLSVASIERPALKRHFIGHRPNVPAFMSGSPRSMVRAVKQPRESKILKIAVHPGRSYGIEPNEILNRGIAIVSVLQGLENANVRLELDIVWRNSYRFGGEYTIKLQIKKASEAWNPAAVAFAVAEQSFQRRLIWNALSIVARKEHVKNAMALYSANLGSGHKAKFPEYDYAFGFLTDGDGDYTTITKAHEAIKKQLSAGGF